MIKLRAPFLCGLVSDLVIIELKEYDAVYDVKCPYGDQPSLNFKLKTYCDSEIIGSILIG